MPTHQKSYTATASPFVVDLTKISDLGILGQDGFDSALSYSIADFDIEVTGNDSAVTMTATGPFPNSEAKAVTDGVFDITTGGKKTISNAAIAKLTFTYSGAAGFTVNIVRRIK